MRFSRTSGVWPIALVTSSKTWVMRAFYYGGLECAGARGGDDDDEAGGGRPCPGRVLCVWHRRSGGGGGGGAHPGGPLPAGAGVEPRRSRGIHAGLLEI